MHRHVPKASGISALLFAALGTLATPAHAGELLDRDVATAVDRGVVWLAANGAFTNPSAAGDAAGLTMLALLRRTPEGFFPSFAQGYENASAADQARPRTAAAYLLDRVNETTFFAFRDGPFLLALALYARTGGPDKGEVVEIPPHLGAAPQARVRHRHRDLPALRRPAAPHRQHRATGAH
jgi:hypothetical protein